MVAGDGNGVADCGRCVHHMITHDAERPHGCRAYGFQSREVPSAVVRRESGMPCQRYEPRPLPPAGEPKRGSGREPGGLYG